jgi:hypothetical protein
MTMSIFQCTRTYETLCHNQTRRTPNPIDEIYETGNNMAIKNMAKILYFTDILYFARASHHISFKMYL